jgi:hypothetical protein
MSLPSLGSKNVPKKHRDGRLQGQQSALLNLGLYQKWERNGRQQVSSDWLARRTVEVKLRPTISRPVTLGVRHPSGTHDQFFFLLGIFFGQLRVCYFVAPSLTRGRVCTLLLLLVLANAVPRDSRPYFIVLILETPPTWSVRSPYLYPPRTWWPRYTPGHWVRP